MGELRIISTFASSETTFRELLKEKKLAASPDQSGSDTAEGSSEANLFIGCLNGLRALVGFRKNVLLSLRW